MAIVHCAFVSLFVFAEKQIELTKPIRKTEGRKVAGKFQGEPTYLGLMTCFISKLKASAGARDLEPAPKYNYEAPYLRYNGSLGQSPWSGGQRGEAPLKLRAF